MTDPGQCGVELTMGEDGSNEINTDDIQSEALTAVERRCICGSEGELPVNEGVAGVKGVLKGDPRDEDILGFDVADTGYPTQNAYGNEASTYCDNNHANVLDQPTVNG